MLKNPSINTWYIGVIFLALILGSLLFGFSDVLSSWYWYHVPFHSTVETMGGITALLIGAILFGESQHSMDTWLTMVATGFASMGVLDTAHAISRPGDSFIFLHSVASLSGGFFFSTVWLVYGRRLKGRFEQYFIFWGSIILSISVGLRALINPGDVPRIMPLFDGKFTMAAILINTVASLLFLVSVPKFLIIYRQHGRHRSILFMVLAIFFGIAEMIFQFSSPWNGIWWAWHLIRLFAFIATLFFVGQQYVKNQRLKP